MTEEQVDELKNQLQEQQVRLDKLEQESAKKISYQDLVRHHQSMFGTGKSWLIGLAIITIPPSLFVWCFIVYALSNGHIA